jgi:hypothetical protein
VVIQLAESVQPRLRCLQIVAGPRRGALFFACAGQRKAGQIRDSDAPDPAKHDKAHGMVISVGLGEPRPAFAFLLLPALKQQES